MYLFLTMIILCIHNAMLTMFHEEINPDFILRSDLMPSSLLVIDSEDKEDESVIFTNITSQHKGANGLNSLEANFGYNGSWFDAYNTMSFHRKMLNEYLCRNFVVKEIISEMRTPILSRRAGRPFVKYTEKDKGNHKTSNKRKSRLEHNEVAEELLSDPGSSNYRNWLSKTTTLEDVYRHYDMAVSKESDLEKDKDDEVDYEAGEFTGYAVPNPSYTASGKNDYHQENSDYFQPFSPSPSYPPLDLQHTDMEKHGHDFDYAPHHVHFHASESEKSSHGLALNDIFDIALTTIAFLSFGLFVLQVLMCITMNKPMMAMMTMPEVVDPVDEMRLRRDVSMTPHPFEELAKRILISIEAGLLADEDKGACLRWSLCENNRYSRSLENKQKFWIPVWGLGMSWLSSRFIKESPMTSIILESLRACALGLAKTDCSSIYSACNLRHLFMIRKNKMK